MQTIEAPDRASALRALASRGVVPRSLEAVGGRRVGASRASGASRAAPGGGLRLGGAVMSRSEMATFVRELATAVNAGLPIITALKTSAGQGRSPAQKAMLERVIGEVERGRSLADAMASTGKPFTELLINLVRSGEIAGRLGEILEQAAVLLERELKLRRQIVAALVYPAILAVVIILAIITVVTLIVPKVLESVAGVLTADDLRWPTKLVMWVAEFFGSWWWAVIIGAVLAVLMWRRVYADAKARLFIDTTVLKVPILGRLMRDVAVARFTRTFGTLAGAGLPVLTGLEVTRRTLGNAALERAIDGVRDDVSHGSTLADPLERTGFFPPLLVQLVGMGEKTGKLDSLLIQAADAFEERTEQSVKLLTSALPPLMIVMIAPVVALIILAVLLPLMDVQSSIGG